MKARVAVFASIVAALPGFFPHKASACSCAHPSPCEAFGYSSAVFVGQMIEGSDKVSERSQGGRTISYEAGKVRFSVQESFKGIFGTEVTIFVLDMKGTSCGGYGLGRGLTYVVYAG